MSDEQNQQDNQQGEQNEGREQSLANISELELLKNRARMLGIPFSNNIGVDALKVKIDEKLAGISSEEQTQDEEFNPLEAGAQASEANQNDSATSVEKFAPKPVQTLREMLHEQCMALVRCRITNMNPNKKDLPGEIIVVANEYIGTVRKYIPFGEYTDEGYHIPKVIYETLLTRKFLNITSTRDRRTGAQQVRTAWANEFAIEVLEPLTKAEIAQLAQAQIAAGSLDSSNAA